MPLQHMLPFSEKQKKGQKTEINKKANVQMSQTLEVVWVCHPENYKPKTSAVMLQPPVGSL